MIIRLSGPLLPAVALALVSCAAPESPDANAGNGGSGPAAAARPSPAAKPERPRLRPSERGKVTSISLEEAFALQQTGNVLIYDARPSVFYHLGRIQGAISMPKSICDDVITVREAEIKAAVAAKKPIIVYCTGPLCPDARTVAMHLASAGYSSSVLEGGWDAWKDGGLPVD